MNQISKNIELFLDTPDFSVIINYCLFLFFHGVSKESLSESLNFLMIKYNEDEYLDTYDVLFDVYDLINGNGTAWFKFPFICIPNTEIYK